MPSNQRHLPHRYKLNNPIFITFRLHGSLPPGREFPKGLNTSGKAFVCMDRLLDTNLHSARYLRQPDIAQGVYDTIQSSAQHSYELHTWVIMPNHVHLLMTPATDVSRILQQIKGASAHAANAILGLTGQPFWQNESYDHLVRNEDEFRRIDRYILQTPVKAGLVECAGDYRWSSAFAGVGLKSSAG